MRRVKPGMGCVIPVLIVVGICVGIYKVVLWCERRPELTTGIAIGLVIGGLVAFVAGNVWASLLLKKGGEIGARRAEAETKVDVAKIRAAIQAMRTFGGQQQ